MVYLPPPFVAEGIALFPQPVVSDRACEATFLNELALASLAKPDIDEALDFVAAWSSVAKHQRLAERLLTRPPGQTFAAAAQQFFPAWIVAAFDAAETRGTMAKALSRIRERLMHERVLFQQQSDSLIILPAAMVVLFMVSTTADSLTYHLEFGPGGELWWLAFRSIPLLLACSPLGSLIASWNQAIHAGRVAVLLGAGVSAEPALSVCRPETLSRFRPRVLRPSTWNDLAVRAASSPLTPQQRRRIATWSQRRTDGDFSRLGAWYRAVALPLTYAGMATFLGALLLLLRAVRPVHCLVNNLG